MHLTLPPFSECLYGLYVVTLLIKRVSVYIEELTYSTQVGLVKRPPSLISIVATQLRF